ncbi:prolipoprotein diacylglyceryl transferase [Mycetocola manganoxydans]|uniref:Phosphatidylglycerol--prolipoprotein diacylglyceryl transferase n=1 Tax=Mycetocola manganoxydans TaxID=699879 RepID=A0A3L6ZYJ6_9MICO|nr:prolipoprotein diacylglyceryl transferase [Mycetocola manganoxydans]RLP72511.1 prolipoprotein diacylglyceryl transferase [Mycetocola manganoxydans]GHD39950.1 prolipoprotein diacylglyceryl transferase 2 [Mycetocola manganoxydans]
MSIHLSIPSPEINSIQLGNFTIYFYAICILVGIVAAAFLTNARLTRRGAEPGIVLDIILWAVPLGIVGARIFHVLTHPNDYFYPGADLLRTLYVWEGGIAIFGALIGGAVGAWIGCRMTGIRFWTFADAVAPALLLAQAFGRFGNWFNQELFGIPTTLPWGLEIEQSNPAWPVGLPAGTLFHPTFLYEVLWNLAGVAVLLILERRFRLQWGKVLGLYLLWYGIGRTVWESIRIDPSEVFLGLRVNVWAALLAIVVGLLILAVQSRRHTGFEPSPYVAGREWNGSGAGVHSSHTDSDYVDLGEPEETPSESGDALATSDTAPKS